MLSPVEFIEVVYKVLFMIGTMAFGASIYCSNLRLFTAVCFALCGSLFAVAKKLGDDRLENQRRFECDSPNIHVIHKIDHIIQAFPHPKELQEMLAFRREFGFKFRIEGKVQIDSGNIWEGYLYFKYDSTEDKVLAKMISYTSNYPFTDWAVMSPYEMRALFIAYYAKLGLLSTKSNSVVNMPGLDMAHNGLVYKTGEGAKYHVIIPKDRVPPLGTRYISSDSTYSILSYQDGSGNTGYVILPKCNYDAADCVVSYLLKRSE
jgi:hypothetical protein